MTHKDAIDIVNAIKTLSDHLDIKPTTIGNSIAFCNPETKPTLKQAQELYNEFYDADVVARAEMLGLTVIEPDKPK